MRDSGKTVTEISKQLKRTYKCVNNFLKRDGDYRHGGGPAKKFSESMKRHLVRHMSGESHVSLQKIVTQLHVPAEKTVRNFLKTEGYKYTSPKRQPSLTYANKKRRAEWSKNVLEQITAGQINIENIIFTDEKRFSLDGPDGCRKYWQLEGEEKRCFGKNVFSPGVMVWAGIGSRETTIHFCEKNVDSQYYQSILNENYLPFHQQGFILMQDNATPHTSQSTLKFLEDKNIDVLEWAPHSPDCNPIEHLLGDHCKAYLWRRKRILNNRRLEKCDKKSVGRSEDRTDSELVRSFPKRLIQVVANRGGPTRTYWVSFVHCFYFRENCSAFQIFHIRFRQPPTPNLTKKSKEIIQEQWEYYHMDCFTVSFRWSILFF